MPDPKFSKPWRGAPREQIAWNPTILEDVCIGCGACVTGCGRLVYRFDFDRKKPVVADPLNCMVGCAACANTCPAHAIVFPPIESVLAPVEAGACFCEFVPGQYIELWRPGSDRLSRSYSIANAPEGDGRIALNLRRVAGGRFTDWAFEKMQVGDTVRARGPLGGFTFRSPPDRPLLFIAGGAGFAPIHALVTQQARFQPARDTALVWGMRAAAEFYALDDLAALAAAAPGLRIMLAAEQGTRADLPAGFRLIAGTVVDALADLGEIGDRDIYAAGPPMLLRALSAELTRRGVDRRQVHIDSFGV